jgi:phospholipase C
MSGQPTVKNVIVLMLENRSYDNVLGGLYASGNPSPYKTPPPGQSNLDGVANALKNKGPNGKRFKAANQTATTQINGTGPRYPSTVIPAIDPGETFENMAQQIFNSKTMPTKNEYPGWPKTAPHNAMRGFVKNYADPKEGNAKSSNWQDVMNYLSPAQLPVTAFLANNFAICDNWFASVPTQTFTNRVFGHCAAPGVTKKIFTEKDYFSMVDDTQYITDQLDFVQLPSIFEALDQQPPKHKNSDANWKLYFHDYSISIMTVPYVANVAGQSSNINITTFDSSDWESTRPHQLVSSSLPSTFLEDLSANTLPPYSFIEPRYSYNYVALHDGPTDPPSPAVNSNHPGGGNYPPFAPNPGNPPIDAASGELLLMSVYNALRASDCWESSLLIVTYDECGGTSDHVQPPSPHPCHITNWLGNDSPPFTAVPAANDDDDKASNGFEFNAYGARVPAIVISPFIEQGSTLDCSGKYPFDHASIVSTVRDAFLPTASTPLTSRDENAPSVLDSSNYSLDNRNATGLFSGVILTAPSFLIFTHEGMQGLSQLLQASSGSAAITLSFTANSGETWLSVGVPSTSNGITSCTVTADLDNRSAGTYIDSIEISGSGLTTVTIPVTLVVPDGM